MNHNFFSSNENLVGATESIPLLSLDNCMLVTGITPDNSDSAAIVEASGEIALEANNENLIWHGGCIHRCRSPLGYGPEALRRGLTLQRNVDLKLEQSPEPIRYTRPAIFLGHAFGWNAFGHLHDTLQRLYYCEDIIGDPEIMLILNRHDRIIEFDHHLKAVAGRDFLDSDILVLDNTTLRQFEKIFYPHSPAVMTSYTEDSLSWIREKYFTYFTSSCRDPTRLYLSRTNVRPGSRGVVNEHEAIAFLLNEGFAILDGTEPLAKIVDLFSRAEIVIAGNHGSLLAHSYLCPAECVIHEYCPKTRIDVTQKNKLKCAKQYNQYIVDSDKNHNIVINQSMLRQIL